MNKTAGAMGILSDKPIDHFRIKFFLDTNILTYLIDNSFSGLSKALEYFKNCIFTDLISSHYVIFEFVGIRKREHYQRDVLAKNSEQDSSVSASSLSREIDEFNCPVVRFADVKLTIEEKVRDELKKIVNDYGIVYENNLLHNKLLQPTFDINLGSRISKEDSLVLVSSIWPDELTLESFIFLLSNDREFVKAYSEVDLNSIFSNYSLSNPILEHLKSMQLDAKHCLNLTDDSENHKLQQFLPNKVKELLINKNESLFLGKTVRCGNSANFPRDVVCFKLNSNTELNQGIFITFIGKDLDFIYTTRTKVDDFWDQTSIQNYPYVKTSKCDISFRPLELDDNGDQIRLPDNVISKLRETGNLVFINPDS